MVSLLRAFALLRRPAVFRFALWKVSILWFTTRRSTFTASSACLARLIACEDFSSCWRTELPLGLPVSACWTGCGPVETADTHQQTSSPVHTVTNRRAYTADGRKRALSGQPEQTRVLPSVAAADGSYCAIHRSDRSYKKLEGVFRLLCGSSFGCRHRYLRL
jgi:hypothetical protein